jgi:acetyltransferase-like isoleucine patch superfamily enzyme
MGQNVIIHTNVKIINPHNISIMTGTHIDSYTVLLAGENDNKINAGSIYFKENKKFPGKVGELIIGKYCHIAPFVLIQSVGGVYIGDFSGIASGSKIYSASHHYRNLQREDNVVYKFTPFAPVEEQSIIVGPVVFEGNNALGLNSVVLPGVTIGKNSWVGVSSYVVEDIPPNSIAIGCPAKVIKRRNIKE